MVTGLHLDVWQHIAIIGGVNVWLGISRMSKRFSLLGRSIRRCAILAALTVETVDLGSKYWTVNGKLHRENDQPAIIGRYGYKAWYANGKKHRENDRPAVSQSLFDWN